MHLLSKNAENTHSLNEISSKNFKSLNGPRFNSCISISYTIKKFTQEFHSLDLSFEAYIHFFQTL